MTNSNEFDLSKIGALPAVDHPQSSTGPKKYGPKPEVFTFYKLKSAEDSKSYQITKFNSELDVESQYWMNFMPTAQGGYYDCLCPASKFECRHKGIMKTIINSNQVNGDKFLCFETGMFKLATEIK